MTLTVLTVKSTTILTYNFLLRYYFQAVLLVADDTNIFELTGNGDVLEPEHGVMGEIHEYT